MSKSDVFDLIRPAEIVSDVHGGKSFGERLFKVLPSIEIVYPIKKDEWIRVSRLKSACAREEVLASRLGVARERDRSASFEMVCGIGVDFQRWVRKAGAGLLVGAWRCLRCRVRTDLSGDPPRIPRPAECRMCGGRRFRFVERAYRDFAMKVKSHPDGFWRMNQDPDDDEGLEFKTANQWQWTSREEPSVDYVKQVQSYMWLTNLRRWRIVIVNKAGQGNSPSAWFREYCYGRDEFMIREITDAAKEIRRGLSSPAGQLPARICAGPECKRAAGCQLVGPCFGGVVK